MRIISGTLKGRSICPPTNLKLRPTTDMAKESLFNILAHSIEFEETDILDLFAGTGSISYEFVSRGAKRVVAVERDERCVAFIRKMAGTFAMENLRVVKGDVFTYVVRCKEQFNLIFADPPFDLEIAGRLPEIILSGDILTPGGLFILEHSKAFDFSGNPYLTDHRAYSRVHFSFFTKKSHL